MYDEPIIVPCPVCGCEDETAGIETHPPRKWGSNQSNQKIPAGESFYCANKIECGFYVEVNRQGVLQELFEHTAKKEN